MGTRDVKNPPADTQNAAAFLPNFCAIRMLFTVVVVAQLFVFILLLASWKPDGHGWDQLGVLSLFVQWIALASLGSLCALRGWLMRFRPLPAAFLSYAVLLLVTLLVSIIGYRLLTPLAVAEQAPDLAIFLLRSLGMAAIIGALLLRYFYVRHQWEQQVQAEAQARIEALAARIRPHFLFNSLNTIASLTSSKPALAEELVQDLSDLFRMSMQDVQARIPLSEELDIARRYLNIETQRLGERLRVEWTTKNLPLERLVPPLILQPILENAVYYGIEPRMEGGTIEILATFNRGRLRLEVRNPLVEEGAVRHHKGNQMALANIAERIRLAFGPAATLETEIRDNQYRVRLLMALEDEA